MNNANVLKVSDLSVSYGPVQAVKKVDLEVNEGEVVTLLGSNGAGKSTLLKAILGISPASRGTITFMGRDITHQATENIVASGISMVPEGRGILALMTVMENLELGAYYVKRDFDKYLGHIFESFPFLAERKNQAAGTLSGGEQQILAIARALISSPKLLVMDEPSLGLAPVMVNEVYDIVVELKARKQTILLTEQNARKALRCADRGYVFEHGSVVLEGAARELADNPEVRKAYLGGVD